ncbi:MAG TPA: choice-of-anchor R domain-containing protein [Bryobacteraceae bacterium]|nr:choice-of-anchor R domain-containing protein [Bryobacteraceae bacterium]
MCIALLAAPLQSDEIANTTGKGDWAADGANVGLWGGENWTWAVSVRPSIAYTLTSISLPLSLVNPPGVVNIVLAEDDHGFPGRLIEKFTIAVNDHEAALQKVTSIQHPQLAENTLYWVFVTAANPTRIYWHNTSDNPPPRGCKVALRENRSSWIVQHDQFRPPGLILSGEPFSTLKVARVTGQSYPRVLP